MSTSPVGFTTMPKLLPVTGAFVLPFTAYFAVLSTRVVRQRLADEHYMGDTSTKTASQVDNELFVASRSHVNFAENVPLAFLLATFVELNGGSRKALSYLLGTLFTLRVVHAELGIRGKGGMGNGRPIGYFGSLGVMGGLAGYSFWLVKEYWGL